MKNRRISLSPASIQLREAEGGMESRTLEGYALKFGVRSVLLGYNYPFYEILEPGCVSYEMLREQRIYFTMFHDRQAILGRWDKGEGSLRLTIDSVGLKVECEMPHTPDGDKALELVRRGDLSEMSFAYWAPEGDREGYVKVEDSGEKTEDGQTIYIRHIYKITDMFDVTVAASPAYPDTEIEAREAQIRDVVERDTEEPAPFAVPGEEPEEVEPKEETPAEEVDEPTKEEEVVQREFDDKAILCMRMERMKNFIAASKY